jgi:tRNA(His) 5'-end guanylyltransferase
MSIKDELGNRMKEYYENIPKTKLMRRTPVIVRVDGRAFHTFTRGFARPFDEVFSNAMTRTMEYLGKNVSGCIFAYKQSDEITLVLSDYKRLNSEAFFDYEVMKVCSITASMATMAFNKYFIEEAHNKFQHIEVDEEGYSEDETKLFQAYSKAIEYGAMFDSRCFNIPKEEVVNCVYWRQIDAERNSIQMLGQAHFSQKQLDHKSRSAIKEMLLEKGIDWEDTPIMWKRGVCWTREKGIDYEMPMLRGEDRKYLEHLVYYQEGVSTNETARKNIIKLRKEMFDMVVAGAKKSTSRLGERDVKIGDKLILEMTEDESVKYETVVTDVIICHFNDLTEEEAKLEGYESLREMQYALEMIYGPNHEDVFTLIHFK